METPITLKDLKPGDYVMWEGEPCKVESIAKSKTGKHGSCKVRIEVVGLFDNKKRFIMKPGDSTAMAPIIEKKNGQVISISGDIAQIMDLSDYSTLEATIPAELKGKITEGANVLYWKFGHRLVIKSYK